QPERPGSGRRQSVGLLRVARPSFMLHVNFQRAVSALAQPLGAITDRIAADRVVGEEGAALGRDLVQRERPEGLGGRQLTWLEAQHVAAAAVECLASGIAD